MKDKDQGEVQGTGRRKAEQDPEAIIGSAWRPGTGLQEDATKVPTEGIERRLAEAAASSRVSPARSIQGSAKVAIRGVVRSFQERIETSSPYAQVHVWTFRLERYDVDRSSALEPIPIEMRGKHIDGGIQDGDEVELFDQWKPGRVLKVKELYNATTKTPVKLKSTKWAWW